MIEKIFLLAICTLAIGIEAKTIPIAPSYPYIFNLELKFKEDRITDYIIDSFFATNGEENSQLLHCDVTFSDILRAIPYKKLAVSDLTTAINELNLTLAADDIGNLISNLDYKELSVMGFTMARLQKTIAKTYFKTNPTGLLECLNILGIAEEFSMAVAFGTDEDLFKAFQKGNFSQDNLVKIRNTINTPTTAKDILNILGVKKFNQIHLSNFINNKITPLLLDNGLTEENLKQFLKSLNVSLGNYKNNKAFKTCYSAITSGNSLAVAISPNEMITNDDSVILKYINLEQYATLSAKNTHSDGISYTLLADNINANRTDNVISIKIDTLLPSFIEETNTYSDMTNTFCHYVSLNDDELESQDSTANFVNDQLVISKLFNTHFQKGSPLICGQKLYGLASIDKINAIVFDTFEESISEEILSMPDHYKPEIINIIKDFFDDLKANFDPCKYDLCGSNNEEQENTISNVDESVTSAGEDLETIEENNNGNSNIVPGDDENNNDVTEIAEENNVNENTDVNNNLEQNEQENEITQNEDINAEDEILVTDDLTGLDEQNDITNNPEVDSNQAGETVEDHSNDQEDTSVSQEVPENDVVNPDQNIQEPGDNQSNVDEVSQNPEEGDDNQANVEDLNQIPQEADDNQDNVSDINQEPQEAVENQDNVSDVNQEPQGADEKPDNVSDANQEPQEADENQENVNDANQETQGANDNQEDVNDVIQDTQAVDDNQQDVNDVIQETQEADNNQEDVNDINQGTQGADGNQEDVNVVNQETQDVGVNQENINDMNEETHSEGSGQDIQNVEEQEQKNSVRDEDPNIVETNSILEGRAL